MTPIECRVVAADSFRPAEHARVFGRVAAVYEQSRPGYPTAAVQWLVGIAPRRVLDLGAGTGKLTAALVGAGHAVVAVDPSVPMLDVLRAAVPQAGVRPGSAEAIPAADGEVDVVTVAQAFHWFDHAVAVPEVARVLRPYGRLALVWNLRDESTPWVGELSRIIGSLDASTAEVDPALRAARSRFDDFEHAVFRHAQHLNRDALLALVSSRSYIAVRPVDEQVAILAEVGLLYDRHAGPHGLTLPYLTLCYRAAVRG